MPVCHGAGGLAAQHRFGARSGASIMLLGAAKLLLGLVFGGQGSGLLTWLARFPHAVLGVMVLAAGLELAKVGSSLNHGAADLWEASVDGHRSQRALSDTERLERFTVMLVTTAGILAFKNDAVGFLAGMACHGAYRLADVVGDRWWPGRGVEGNPLLGC
jgi:xanthine/uracil permease